MGRTASPTCQRGKGSPAEGGGEQLWFLPPAPQGTLPSHPPAPGREDTACNLGQEKHSPPPPTTHLSTCRSLQADMIFAQSQFQALSTADLSQEAGQALWKTELLGKAQCG